jgi:hypothetical protein
MIVLAHFSSAHWWVTLIYLVPSLGICGWILWQLWRDQRDEGARNEKAAIDRARAKKRGWR